MTQTVRWSRYVAGSHKYWEWAVVQFADADGWVGIVRHGRWRTGITPGPATCSIRAVCVGVRAAMIGEMQRRARGKIAAGGYVEDVSYEERASRFEQPPLDNADALLRASRGLVQPSSPAQSELVVVDGTRRRPGVGQDGERVAWWTPAPAPAPPIWPTMTELAVRGGVVPL